MVPEITLAPQWKKDIARMSEKQELHQFESDYPNHSPPTFKWESGPGLLMESVCCAESSLPRPQTSGGVGAQEHLEGC